MIENEPVVARDFLEKIGEVKLTQLAYDYQTNIRVVIEPIDIHFINIKIHISIQGKYQMPMIAIN
jgi:hypothetical protein